MRKRRSLSRFSTLLLLASPCLGSGSIHVVATDGTGDFTEILDAASAAADGDVILVRSGDYLGFVVFDKSLSIVADVGATVSTGPVEITDVDANEFVFLAGFTVSSVDTVAIWIHDSAGHVRIQELTALGGPGILGQTEDGQHAAFVENAENVVFTACTLRGGDSAGGGTDYGDYGGIGLKVLDSVVAAYDTDCFGGYGEDAQVYDGGNGADGAYVNNSFLFASGSLFRGGSGGDFTTSCSAPGSGGDGLHLTSSSTGVLLDNEYVNGVGAGCNACFICSCCVWGSNGTELNVVAATAEHLPGTAHTYLPERIAFETIPQTPVIEGEWRERVLWASSQVPRFEYQAPRNGIVGVAGASIERLGPLPPNGSLSAPVPTPMLTSGEATTLFSQAFFAIPVDTSPGAGTTVAANEIPADVFQTLGAPGATVVIGCAISPDCNANGAPDLCEILAGAATDCDENGVLDACQGDDCDGNGVFDACDVTSGALPDCNANFVPDGCEDFLMPLFAQKLTASDAFVNDRFGTRVSASGSWLAVSNVSEDIYLFERNGAGDWIERQKIDSPADVEQSLYLRGATLFVGAPRDDTALNNAGAVFVYTREPSGTWVLSDTLMAHIPASNANFGEHLAFSNGRLAVRGGVGVYVFEEIGGAWAQTWHFLANFNGPMSMSGDRLLIGNPLDGEVGPTAGAAFVYVRNANGTWSQEEKLVSAFAGNGYRHGTSVSLAGDLAVVGGSNYVSIGTFPHRELAVFRRQPDGSWIEEAGLLPGNLPDGNLFGQSVWASGDTIWAGAPWISDGPGQLVVFKRNAGAWNEAASFTSPDPALSDYFGETIDPSGLVGVVSAPTIFTNDIGAVYVYGLEGDCNGNGIPDACDIASFASDDVNVNGVPDECEPD